MLLRFLILMIFFPLMIRVTDVMATEPGHWVNYPDTLPKFDYSGDKLRQHWPQLTKSSFLPYPSAEQLQSIASQFPSLIHQQYKHPATVHSTSVHPALIKARAGDFNALSEAITQVWRYHYQGEFEEAYTLGIQLGYAGLIPAFYAKMMYTTLLESGPERRLKSFQEVIELSETIAEHTANYLPALFGLTYAYARELELLPTSAAVRSGHLEAANDLLTQLREQFPQRAIYPAMLGGLHAGVVERVGSFVGRLTYGSTESRAINYFQTAIELENELPVIFNEYAKAMIRLDSDKFATPIEQALKHCVSLPVFSAEEALNQQACQNKLSTLTLAGN